MIVTERVTALTAIMALIIISINVRSIAEVKKRTDVLNSLAGMKADIICLQECGIPFQKEYKDLRDTWTLGESFWSGSNVSRADGIAVLLKNPFIEVKAFKVIEAGRLASLDFKYKGAVLRLVNVYAPTSQRERVLFLPQLRPLLIGTLPVIISGDFNCALRDVDRSKPRNDRSSRDLAAFVEDFELCDAGRDLVPLFTWVSSSGSSFSRIDVMSSEAVFFSDHRLLTTEVLIPSTRESGPGVWKLNTSLLDDPRVIKTFSRRLEEWRTLKDLFDSRIEWWEMVKKRTKGYFIQLGKRKARERQARYSHLNAHLQRLSLLQLRGFDLAEEVARVKLSLSALYREEQEKIKVLSRVCIMEDDDKCSRFFFKKTKERRPAMSSMIDSSGQEVEGREAVETVMRDFYRELYDQKVVDQNLIHHFLSLLESRNEGDEGTRSWEEAISKVQKKIHGWSRRTLTMAGKVLVVKAILFPILLYVGMIFPPDKVIAKLVTRIIFRFVWGSKMERLKRVQMVKGTLDGGRGVPDVVRLIKAQGLAYVVKNIQAAGKKVSFMNRFYFASSLRPFGLCAMDNIRPHSWDPPPFYRALRAFALEVGLHKVVLASWDYKTICSQMRSTQETSRIEDFPPETCRFIWANATHVCLTNTQKDVSWMAVSPCLPTRVFMHRRVIAPYDTCPYKGCLGKETEAHIFRDCPSAYRVWLLFSPFLHRFAVPARATAQQILYGPARGLTSSTLRCWWRVVCAVKQALWEGRNICLFNKQELDPIVIARRGMVLVRDYVNLEVHQRGKEEAYKNWHIQDLGELRIP
ncbi:uncharacterized protein LOC136744565 [Amia ocellicauda]|uniref:uncharacterized protein LOC136744565 n=1 Tax=Amia ocellicauda TaxID=2972642 RepID=UPI003464BCE0